MTYSALSLLDVARIEVIVFSVMPCQTIISFPFATESTTNSASRQAKLNAADAISSAHVPDNHVDPRSKREYNEAPNFMLERR